VLATFWGEVFANRLTVQVVALVDFRNKKRIAAGEEPAAFAELVHNAARTSTSPSAFVPTILPSSKIWSVQKKRLLIGSECLCLQGMELRDFVVDQRGDWSQQFYMDLAGNASESFSYLF
jgi:hypothetical protein